MPKPKTADPIYGITFTHCSNIDELLEHVGELASVGKQISITKAEIKGWNVAFNAGPTTAPTPEPTPTAA